MGRRLILDTGVLVASERSGRGLGDVIAADDDLVIGAVTDAELRTGVERATERHRAGRAAFLARILETLPVELYDLTTADAHGRLLAPMDIAAEPGAARTTSSLRRPQSLPSVPS